MELDPKSFVEAQVRNLRRKLGRERALIAVSGGVDSTTCAALAYRAVGKNLICALIDTGFMRLGEPERVRRLLSGPPLSLPVRVIEAEGAFMERLAGVEDAEEKRRRFRDEFYKAISEVAEREGCRFLIQGTIAPDWIETKGGIKTQHNVLAQIGVRTEKKYGFTLLEPLANLYKDQVRAVARFLGVPKEISERQPFPGPGLLVRCVGEIKPEKLSELKKATEVVEGKLADRGFQQYFAAILDGGPDGWGFEGASKLARAALGLNEAEAKVFKNLATGVKGDERAYGGMVGVKVAANARRKVWEDFERLILLQSSLISKFKGFTRVLYLIADRDEGSYDVSVRAVTTRDYMTADVAKMGWELAESIGLEILSACPRVKGVYYDVTPKPPATIEYE
ncbi:TPA: GMP synthase [Candidatus Bathyarchaeota archaeon]|nr:GMP synthase [Candidatus Bathyarchaeota archaeon]